MSAASTSSSVIDAATKTTEVAAHAQPDSVLRDAARTKRRLYFAVGAVAMVGAWSFWSTHHSVPDIALSGTSGHTKENPPLNVKVFDAPVWTLAALPPPPPAPPAPPPSLNEQLLAVTMNDAIPAALFYRPMEDRIVTLHVGDSIGGRTIRAIAADKVILIWKSAAKAEVVETLYTDLRDAKGGGGEGGTQ